MLFKKNKNKSLIIGIIILISSIIFIPWNINILIIKRKYNVSLNKNRVNDNISNTYYKSEIENALLQIKVLKRTIEQNISIYNDYKKLFSCNINYVNTISKVLKNKIYLANLSIENEINILYKMIYIVNIHPYSYEKLFKNDNYSIPKISLYREKKYSTTESQIKSHSAKVNKSCENINNISYKSEEDLVGFHIMTSLISCTKSLLVSKINLNFNYILCFSNYLNNLTNFDKFINGNTIINNNKHLITKNHFINKNNKYLKTKSNNKNNDFSSNYTESKNISHKSWIIAIPAIIIGLIMATVIIGKRKREQKIKNTKRVCFEANNIDTTQGGSQISVIVPHNVNTGLENNDETEIENSDDFNPVESQRCHIEEDKILICSPRKNNYEMDDKVMFSSKETLVRDVELATTSSAAELEQYISNISASLSSDMHLNPDYIELYLPKDNNELPNNYWFIQSSNNNPVDEQHKLLSVSNYKDEEIPGDGSYLISVSKPYQIPSHDHSLLSSNDVPSVNDWDNLSKYIINNWHSGNSAAQKSDYYTHSISYEEWEEFFKIPSSEYINEDNQEDKVLISVNAQKTELELEPNKLQPDVLDNGITLFVLMPQEDFDNITFMLSWLDLAKNSFFKFLFKRKKYMPRINYVCFNKQLSNLLYQIKFSYLENESMPIISDVFLDIKNILGEKWSDLSTEKAKYFDAYDVLRYFTTFKMTKIRDIYLLTTTNGWFEYPGRQGKEKMISECWTEEKYKYILSQQDQFNMIQSILPKWEETSKYNDQLLKDLFSDTKNWESNNARATVFMSIRNEIYADMYELIEKYKSILNSPVNIKKCTTSAELSLVWKNKFNFVKKFKKTLPVRENYDTCLLDISKEELLSKIKVFRHIIR